MSLTQSYSSRTIAYAGFLPTYGRAVLRRHVGQFGVSVYSFRAASDVEVPQVMVLASHRFFEVLGEMAASPYLEASFSRLLLDKARLDMLVLRPKGQLLKAKVVQCLQWQKQIMDAIEEQGEERVSLQMHRLFDLTCIN